MPNFYDAVYKLAREIPCGRVMCYGQIATILGCPRAARAVGYAMRASANMDVPWQRVINHKGGISARNDVERPWLQRELLEGEGIIFNKDGYCDLRKYRWEPEQPDLFIYDENQDLPFR